MKFYGCIAVVVAVQLCACSPTFVSMAASVPPGIPSNAKTFAIAQSSDAESEAAARAVSAQLERFGFRPSPNPDMLVLVTYSERRRQVGAYANSRCDESDWIVKPQGSAGGTAIAEMQVRIVDVDGTPTYYLASARRALGGRRIPDVADELARAVIQEDPRAARAMTKARC